VFPSYDDTTLKAKLILDTERVRDAAMMLSHQRPYREFPQAWVEAALTRKGMVVRQTKYFPGEVPSFSNRIFHFKVCFWDSRCCWG
jgi:hypothetical protein